MGVFARHRGDKGYYEKIILKYKVVKMNRVTFKTELCKGCGLCVGACPKHLIALDKTKLNAKGYHPAGITGQENCIACAMCATMCPDVVITVERGVEE